MLAGRATEITLATKWRIVAPGKIVDQSSTTTALLARSQSDVVQHSLEPLFKTLVTSRKALLDGNQESIIGEARSECERDASTIGTVEKHIPFSQLDQDGIDGAWINACIFVDLGRTVSHLIVLRGSECT